jgi:pilus assembly protein Flp/PilA
MRPPTWPARIKRFVAAEDGPTSVEYAVLLALIVAVCVGAVRNMSVATGSSFDRSAQSISQALSG